MTTITKKEHDHALKEAAQGFEDHPQLDIVDVDVLRALPGTHPEMPETMTIVTRWSLNGDGEPYLRDDVRVVH